MSLHEQSDIHVYLDAEPELVSLTLNETTLNDQHYEVTDNRLQIDRAAVESFEDDFTVEMLSTEGKWLIEVDVDESSTPRLASNRSLTYIEGKDVYVHFEMFGFSIETLKGSTNDNLQASEYSLKEDHIIIDSSFFDRIFEANPDRTRTVMLIATLEKEDGTVIEPFSIFVP